MISIVFLAPYADLKDEIEQTLRDYVPAEPIEASVYAMDVEKVAGAVFQADVLIARGFSADTLKRRFPGHPVVPLQTSAYDVIDAVSEAISRHGSRKAALIGNPGLLPVVNRSSRILDVEIVAYPAAAAEDVPDGIARAKADGCDCFIGGLSLVQACERLGEKCVLLRTGRTAIVRSLDEAVRLAQSTRTQRENTLFFETLLDYTKEGVVAVNERGLVVSANSSATRYLSLEGDDFLGRSAEQVFPFPLAEELRTVLSGGEAVENELRSFGARMLAIDCVPMHRDRRTVGCVVFLRSVDRLRDEESIIRQKMRSKGQKAKYRFDDIVAHDESMSVAIDKARVYAEVDSPVLIAGESGTGKELFAQGIHHASRRGGGPFIAINCAALSETLLESELFGYSDGAFTGALKGGREGLFEAAHGGTLFLDEISEIPVSFQSKLLRVLQENEVRRVGSQRVVAVDTRIIAATNRNLDELVECGRFRQDLLFRINVLHLHIPPLRHRSGDIMELFVSYIRECAEKYSRKPGAITAEAREILENHPWRGNVRELKNIAERISVLSRGKVVDAAVLREALTERPPADSGLRRESAEARESERLRRLLRRHDGNRGLVAHELGMNRSTLWRKMKKHGLL